VITAPGNGCQVISCAPDGTGQRYLGSWGHVDALTYSDTMPGGSATLACTLQASPSWTDQILNPGRVIRVLKGASIQWEGTLDKPVPVDGTGWTLTARGAGTWGTQYSALWTSWTAANIITAAIGRGLRWVQGSVGGGYLLCIKDSGSITVTDFLNLYTSPGSQTWRVHRPRPGCRST
jgi:hypothetical protein